MGINRVLPIEGFEFRSFENESYLLAKIKSNKWVMPSPDTVKEKLEAFAKNNQVELSGTYIDKIISQEEIQVIAPIK